MLKANEETGLFFGFFLETFMAWQEGKTCGFWFHANDET